MPITVEANVAAPLEMVWQAWTTPSFIKLWNAASLEWFCAKAEVDLHEGGRFSYRMESHNDSYDFAGSFDRLKMLCLIECTINDGRKVTIHFSENTRGTNIKETFDVDPTFPEEEQRHLWQSILNYFKKIVETDLSLS